MWFITEAPLLEFTEHNAESSGPRLEVVVVGGSRGVVGVGERELLRGSRTEDR